MRARNWVDHRRMIQRRAAGLGIRIDIGCHTGFFTPPASRLILKQAAPWSAPLRRQHMKAHAPPSSTIAPVMGQHPMTLSGLPSKSGRRVRDPLIRIRQTLLLAPCALGLFSAALASGQPIVPDRDRPARIGILFGDSRTFAPAEHPAFVGLREVGLFDGRNASLIVRDAKGQPERLPELPPNWWQPGRNVVVTAGRQAVQAGKTATATIPIVSAIISDPVSYGSTPAWRIPAAIRPGCRW